jgi:hypothetical protein
VYVIINYFTKPVDKRLYVDNAVGSYSNALLFTFMEDAQCTVTVLHTVLFPTTG